MEMQCLNETIARHPFWVKLNPRFFHYLDECATVEHYAAGQPIFQEGGAAEHFYVINEGTVSLEAFVPGRGRITLQTLGPGDALGWSWLFPPNEWQFSAFATAPTELIAFGAAGLRERAEENRDFAYELVTRVARVLHQRLQATRRQLIEFYEPID